MRGATEIEVFNEPDMYISIHAPHAGSDPTQRVQRLLFEISIHAPHAGSDSYVTEQLSANNEISIHAPHAGSDFARQFYFIFA